MGPGSVRQVLAMEAQADEWYRRILELKRALEGTDPAAPERESLESDLSKLERELAWLDDAIDERRKHIGNPTW